MIETGTDTTPKADESLISMWSRATEEVLERVTKSKPRLEWTSHESSSPDATNLESLEWWEACYEAESGYRVWVGVPAPAAVELGRLAEVLHAAKEPSGEPESPAPAVQEMMQSLSDAFAALLAEQTGGEVRCRSLDRLETAPSPEMVYSTRVTLSGGTELPILVGFKTATQAMSPQPLEQMPPAPPRAETGNEYGGSLGLLLEMELPLSVRFGQVTMPIEDVLELRAGSNIELDRAIEDHVDLVVNGTVVARGEIVAVEGNYGIRISEVLTRDCRVAANESAK